MIIVLKEGVTEETAEGLARRMRGAGVPASVEKSGSTLLINAPWVLERAPHLLEVPEIETMLASSGKAEKREEKKEGIPFFPDHIFHQGIAVLLLLAGLALLAGFFPPGLTDPAAPMAPPADVEPAWHFLAFYEILKIFPEGWGFLGIFVIVALLLAFLVYPALDRRTQRSFFQRPVAWVAVTAAAALIIITAVGVLT